MRVQKNRIITAEATGDTAREQAAQIRLNILGERYREFSRAAGLRLQEDRVFVVESNHREAKISNLNASPTRIDYMMSFIPEFGETKRFMPMVQGFDPYPTGMKRVTNSHFEMWVPHSFSRKNKVIGLTERSIRKAQAKLPPNFKMPKIIIEDFKKMGFSDAVGAGYSRLDNTLHINALLDSETKILNFLRKTPQWFANTNLEGLYLHELGHKFHYDLIDLQLSKALGREIHVYTPESLDESTRKLYDKIVENINQPIFEYINAYDVERFRFLGANLSKYAATQLETDPRQGIKEIFAEWFAAQAENEFTLWMKAYVQELQEL